jgi:hypothetical protein
MVGSCQGYLPLQWGQLSISGQFTPNRCKSHSSTFVLAKIHYSLQPNGANLTGGSTGRLASGTASATAAFVPFNGNGVPASFPAGTWPAILLGFFGVLGGLYLIRI